MSRPDNADRYPPIADYAVIGDCHTAALISRDGSIDWYCPARFDAPAVFCRVLDAEKGGYLRVTPAARYSVSRAYRGPTNVLDTTFTCDDGQVRVTDFMPIHLRGRMHRGHDVGTSHRVVRLVEGLSGAVELDLAFKPTFDYARARADFVLVPGRGAIASSADEYLALACHGVTLDQCDDVLTARPRVAAGDRLWLTLTYTPDPDRAEEALTPANPARQLARTIDYWQRWAASCTYQGPYRDEVIRSALTLKLLIYEPTGAIVAAPTTSLPEEIGGVRNWDYRFTWLRDSALILYALMTLGFHDEAQDFFVWLDRTTKNDPPPKPQIMYRIDGNRDLPECKLDHLEGYRGSRPVRLGNAAANQRQIDIYGDVLIAAYLFFRREKGDEKSSETGDTTVDSHRPSAETWVMLRDLVEDAASRWQEHGHGIWEVRQDPQDYLYGKLMCWAALDRGIRIATDHGLDAPLDRWKQTRDDIRRAILERGYNPEEKAFTQAFGSRALDASVLMIPHIGFLPATDPRFRSTIDRIQRQLARDGLVCRYCNEDGLPGGEGAFLPCTFWLVDALALAGRLDEAHQLFDRAVHCMNDVGLLSEEINAENGEMLGNFPQGFSHLALIQSAVNLAKVAKHGAEHEAETEAERAGRAGHAAAQGYSARPSHGRKR
jgi:GH15 family glucan-1,4-alpha-glucosidase